MDDKRSTPWLAIVLIVLVLLPVLYLLSLGPVVGLVDRGYLPQEPVAWIYLPLEYFVENGGAVGQVCGDAVMWYVEFFISEQQDFPGEGQEQVGTIDYTTEVKK